MEMFSIFINPVFSRLKSDGKNGYRAIIIEEEIHDG